MITKDWPRLMRVTPVAVVGGEDRTALRTGLPFYAMPAHVTDGDALGEDEMFLFAPAGHQPDDGRTACVRVMSEEECRVEFEAHFKAGGYQYSDSNKANAFGWWLASRRAAGLVAEKKSVI